MSPALASIQPIRLLKNLTSARNRIWLVKKFFFSMMLMMLLAPAWSASHLDHTHYSGLASCFSKSRCLYNYKTTCGGGDHCSWLASCFSKSRGLYNYKTTCGGKPYFIFKKNMRIPENTILSGKRGFTCTLWTPFWNVSGSTCYWWHVKCFETTIPKYPLSSHNDKMTFPQHCENDFIKVPVNTEFVISLQTLTLHIIIYCYHQ